MTEMETAMSTVAKARKSDPQMDKDWNEISEYTMNSMLNTDLGQAALASAEAKGRVVGRVEGKQAEARRIYLALCETMPEAEARRITGYMGA